MVLRRLFLWRQIALEKYKLQKRGQKRGQRTFPFETRHEV